MKKTLALLAAAVALLASCQQKELNAPKFANAIDFRADIGRYTLKATDTAFEENDAVSIIAMSPINSGNVKYTVSNGKLTSDKPICWLDGQTEKTEFGLIYPYNPQINADSTSFEFCVNADQSDWAKYTASDLMVGSAEGSPADKSIKFDVHHMMSKILISIDNQSSKRIKEVFFSGVYGKVIINDELFEATGNQGTIKACPVTLNGAPAWQLIIAPQVSQPELMITTADNEQYTYTLPSPVTFSSGAQSTAKIALTKDNIFTDFTVEITDWTPDNELQFGNGPEATKWELIGTGLFMDDIFGSLYGTFHFEMPADYYEDKDQPGRYLVKCPYTMWPYSSEFSLNPDAGIILCTEGKWAWIEEGSSTGVIDSRYGEWEVISPVEENGFEGGEGYFYEFYDGCYSAAHEDNCYIYAYTSQIQNVYAANRSGMTIFTLPGHVRYPVFYSFDSVEFNEETCSVIFTAPVDLTRIGAGLFTAETAITNDLIWSVINCDNERIIYYNEDCGYDFTHTIKLDLSETGVYRFLIAGDCTYADGQGYYGYRYLNIPFVAPGDTAPACNPEIISAEADKTIPDTAIDIVVKVANVQRCNYLALSRSEFAELNLSEDRYCDYVDSLGTYATGSVAAFTGEGQKIVVSNLCPNTEYVILVSATNSFNQRGWAMTTASTEGAMEFVSIGTGKYYDFFAYEFVTNSEDEYYCSEVEILQEASGKPIYRVINPYGNFMEKGYQLEDAVYGKASDYIQFFTHQYASGNYVFYNPYYCGLDYYDDFGSGYQGYPLCYMHGSGDIYSEPDKYDYTYKNIQLSEGVFQIAPKIMIEGSPYMFGTFRSDEIVIITLPGYTYTPKNYGVKAGLRTSLPGLKPVKDSDTIE